jgi:Cu/Ag efflux protein CusF
MNRKRSICTIIAMAALTIGSAVAFAHNGIEHVMGTVTAITDNSITVDTVKHTTVTVMVDPSTTTFTNKDAKASLKDLKAGDRVVINAKEGADKKLQGISVKWGASSSATTSHADHTKEH